MQVEVGAVFDRWPFGFTGVVLAVYWVMLLHGISTGRLWRRGGRSILRNREPTLFLTAAITMTLMGLLATGGLVWIAVTMGAPLR